MERDPSMGSGCWYLGQVYINPTDKRVIVRKKQGYGWTLNFGRPMAIPMLILITAYALAPFYLLDHYDIENSWAYIAAFIVMFVSLMAFCFRMDRDGKFYLRLE